MCPCAWPQTSKRQVPLETQVIQADMQFPLNAFAEPLTSMQSVKMEIPHNAQKCPEGPLMR